MKYKALIFDLDGTLYYQTPVRIIMAVYMLVHYILRPMKIRELFAVLKYRQLREKLFGIDKQDFNIQQINETAKTSGLLPVETERVINFWMNEAPLKAVRFFRRKKLLEGMKKLQASGKKIIIYSDYPAKEKLKALGFSPDYVFWSNDGIINCMKPDSSGITLALKVVGLEYANILYVGDRFDRDGI